MNAIDEMAADFLIVKKISDCELVFEKANA